MSPIIGTIKGACCINETVTNPNGSTTTKTGNICNYVIQGPGFTHHEMVADCSIISILIINLAKWDDTVLTIAEKDRIIIGEIIKECELNNVDNPLEVLKIFFKVIKNFENIINLIRVIKGIIGCLAIPTLVISIKKGLDNETILTRAVTYGAPIIQELGINILTLLTYTSVILILFFKPFRKAAKYAKIIFITLYIFWGLFIACVTYAYVGKLKSTAEKVFTGTVITIRTFGGDAVSCVCCCIDVTLTFCALINICVLHRSNKNSEFEESNTSKKLQSIIQEVNRKDNQESDGDEVSTGSSKILPPEDYYLSTDDEPIPPPSADNEERTRPNTSILPSSAAVERFRRGTPTAP
ncbi:16594_t:CDS:2, partial [Rhizophagus irregularis]